MRQLALIIVLLLPASVIAQVAPPIQTRYVWNQTPYHLFVCGEYNGGSSQHDLREGLGDSMTQLFTGSTVHGRYFRIHIKPWVLLEPGQWMEMPTDLGRDPTQTDGLGDEDLTYRLQGISVLAMSPISKQWHRMRPSASFDSRLTKPMFASHPRKYSIYVDATACSDPGLLRNPQTDEQLGTLTGTLDYTSGFPSGAAWSGTTCQFNRLLGRDIVYRYRSKDILEARVPLKETFEMAERAGAPIFLSDVFFLEAWPTSQAPQGKWITHIQYVAPDQMQDLQNWTQQWWNLNQQPDSENVAPARKGGFSLQNHSAGQIGGFQ